MYIFQLPEVKNELKNADSVLREKVSEQSRQMAWIISVIYTEVIRLRFYGRAKCAKITAMTYKMD